MKKGVRGFAFIILSLLITSFLISVASAAIDSNELTETGKSWFVKLFGNAFGGGSPLEGAGLKFLFFFLIFLVVLAVTEFIPLLSESKHEWIKWTFSVVVSYLAVMYIAPADFYTILLSYNTLGIVVTSIIPLVVLCALYYKLTIGNSPGRAIIKRILIGIYALVLLWRLGQVMFTDKLQQVSPIAIPVYGGTLIILAILWIFNKQIMNKFFKIEAEELIEDSMNISRAKAEAEIGDLQQQMNSTGIGKNQRAALQKRIDTLKAALGIK